MPVAADLFDFAAAAENLQRGQGPQAQWARRALERWNISLTTAQRYGLGAAGRSQAGTLVIPHRHAGVVTGATLRALAFSAPCEMCAATVTARELRSDTDCCPSCAAPAAGQPQLLALVGAQTRRHLQLPGTVREHLYGRDELDGDGPVLVVEGARDCWAASEEGLACVAVLASIMHAAQADALREIIGPDRPVIVCADADSGGARLIATACRQLARAGLRDVRSRYAWGRWGGPVGDPAAVLQVRGPGALRAALAG